MFTVLSVPDTRTTFTYCCSFYWKRNTNGNFVLSIITLATDTGELWGSGPGPGLFISSEEGIYILPGRFCRTKSQFGRSGGHKTIFLIGIRNLGSSSTQPRPETDCMIFLEKSQVENFSNLLINGCCDHSCSFVYLYLPDLGVMYFI